MYDIWHFEHYAAHSVPKFGGLCSPLLVEVVQNLLACVITSISKSKVKCSHYRPGVAQRVGRGIALLFHDRGTRRGWVVSSTPQLHFTPGKDPVPILQEAGWALGPVWTGRKSSPHWDSIPDRPARSSVAIPTELPGPQHLSAALRIHSSIIRIYIYIYIYI